MVERPLSFLDLGEDLVFVAVERWPATQHYIHDDPDAPDVALLSVGALENLRGDIERRPVLLVHYVRFFVEVVRGTEVDHLDLAIADIDQNILWLEVTVCDILRVAVGNSVQDLLSHGCSLCFSELFTAGDLLKEFAPFT